MFAEYIIAGRASGWSDATARQYAKHLAYWQQSPHNDLTVVSLRNWVVAIRNHWQPATVRSAMICVRGYLRFVGRDDLAAVIKPPNPPARVQRTVTPAEVRALLDAADQPAICGVTPEQAQAVAVRNGAIIALLFDGWLRASELCALTLDAVSVDARRCIVQGKGDREEIVAFGGETASRLRNWLAVRQSASRAFFVSVGGNTPGKPLTTEGLRIVLRNVAKRAGIPHASPHAYRRGGATAAIRNGAPTRWVQAHGRWAKLEMVERYTRSLDPGDMIEEYSAMRRVSNPLPVTGQASALDW